MDQHSDRAERNDDGRGRRDDAAGIAPASLFLPQLRVLLWKEGLVHARHHPLRLASYLLLPSALPALFALLLPLEPAAVRAVLSGLLLFAFGTHQMLALVDVVTEKENRSKESLLMQGLSPRVYWLSKIAVLAALALVSSVTLVAVVARHYPASNLSVLIAFITLFDVTSIAFSLLLSTLMRSSKFATVVGSLIAPFFVVTFSIIDNALYVPDDGDGNREPAFRNPLVLAWFPAAAGYGMLKIDAEERAGRGATWAGLWSGERLGWNFVALAGAAAVFLVMASYLDQVIAQPFGTPKPWYFPFVRQRRRRLSTAAAASAPPPRDPSKFQPDPAGKRAIVVLDAVDRCFGADKVVDGVSLRVYEDEVFAVLGHNGAGKSTLINMMTGIVGLSGGSGSVGGFDLETEMDGVRRLIGICPQFDLHFPDLTAADHVLLFGGLRGLWQVHSTASALNDAVDDALAQMGILAQRNVKATSLSGGEKRKLSVAMAIVGSPKVVILDEPTSGMDPVSRRALWDLLKKGNKGRVTLFTTHQMDEADLLADRKAFINHGRIQCLGTSAFLKNAYNIGYRLSLLAPSSDRAKLAHLRSTLHRFVPDANAEETPNADVPGSTELVAFVPAQRAGHVFSELLFHLDTLKEKGELLFWGVEAPKLEEVFMRTADSLHGGGGEDGEERPAAATDPLLDDFHNPTTGSALARLLLLTKLRITLTVRSPAATLTAVLMSLWTVYALLATLQANIDAGNPAAAAAFAAVTAFLLLNIPSTSARDLVAEKSLGIVGLLRVTTGARFARREGPVELVAEGGDDGEEDAVGAGGQRKPSKGGRAAAATAATGTVRFAAAYWGAAWIVQFAILLAFCAVVVLLAALNNATALVGSGLAMFVAVLLGHAAMTPLFVYVVSLPFKTQISFTNALLVLTLLTLAPEIYAGYLASSGSSDFSFWHTVFSFTVPLYGFVAVITGMGFTYMIGKNRPTPLPPSYYFEWSHHMLAPLLGIFFQIVVLASILVLYELSGEIASWLRSQRSPMPHPIRPSSSEDVDVAQERARVELIEPGGSLDRFGITIKNLHKAFFSRLGNAAPAASSASVATDEEAAPLQPAVPTGRHEYPGPYGLWTNRTALRNLSLAVPRGELFTLLGPNGAGKTTALSLALAELRPVAGDVWLNATAGVGYAPQMDALWPAASVREHLVLFARLKGLRARPAASWAASAARTLNLADAMGKRVSQLSGGMKRKLGFALALVGAVDVLFLDEPSTGVDPAARRTMRAFLQARQHRFATFLTTHSMDEADALSTRIGILVNGALACIGSPGHLKRRFGNSYVLELVFNPAVAAPPLPVATDEDGADDRGGPRAWLRDALPGSELLEHVDGIIARWLVPVAAVAAAGGLARCFTMLEAWRAGKGGAEGDPAWPGPPVADYSLGLASLEMVFMRFAKGQVVEERRA